MSLLTVLQSGVAVSLLFCIVMLAVIVLKTLSFGRIPTYANPQGKSFAGIIYAFGPGMLPWEKESAAKHIWTYIGGTLYHLGILSALFFLAMQLFSYSLPSVLLQIMRVMLVGGILAGTALFLKRTLQPYMRGISSLDDYLSNLLIDIFLLLNLAMTFAETLVVPFYLTAIIVFIYIPFGKIRHCVFFFYTRILFGVFFGRRGVLPHFSEKS
ncbi:MAG: hypothetical protein OEV55_09650 [candidate division Zixibacteria bacterium]|nr:hypothetical protein [candidate division Zixibacteria bacterium]